METDIRLTETSRSLLYVLLSRFDASMHQNLLEAVKIVDSLLSMRISKYGILAPLGNQWLQELEKLSQLKDKEERNQKLLSFIEEKKPTYEAYR